MCPLALSYRHDDSDPIAVPARDLRDLMPERKSREEMLRQPVRSAITIFLGHQPMGWTGQPPAALAHSTAKAPA